MDYTNSDIILTFFVCSCALMAGLGFIAGVKLASLLSY